MTDGTVGEFLDELKTNGHLQNGMLEMAIRDQTDENAALNPNLRAILVGALQEMNRRETGIYTAAAIMIGTINSGKR